MKIFFTFILIMSMAVCVTAIDNLDDTASYLMNNVNEPTVSSVGGEWTVLCLARSGIDVDGQYFGKYYSNAVNYIRSKDGNLHSRKNTEYSRVILTMRAIGKTPEDISGYNLVTPLLNYDKTVFQGINGAIWALVALDCSEYQNAEVRDKYIEHILSKEKKNGGWALSEQQPEPDADITAMALIALSKYKDRTYVNAAIERAINILSDMQNENGGYSAYNKEASESAAQVLAALSELGISYKDPRFIKNGKTLVDNIYSFKNSDGSFSHTDEENLMATEQCFYALISAKRLEENKNTFFDMSDVVKDSKPSEPADRNPDIGISEIKYPGKSFNDITGHKNQKSIELLAQYGIVSGMSDNLFVPEKTMTRAEFAAITVRALCLPIKNTPAFKDVDGKWYTEYVNTAYNYGIVNGVSETDFNPDGMITVEQACVMLERVAKLCGMKNNLSEISKRNILAEFTDYTLISDWAESSVAFCFGHNIADRSVLEINPAKEIKRCQISDMLCNLLKGAELI